MPRKPKDPQNPLTSAGGTLVLKLSDDLDARFRASAEARGMSRSEHGRDLLERGLLDLAVENAELGDRDVLRRRVERVLLRLDALLTEHAPADAPGTVAEARRAARFLAQWSDERAASSGLLFDRMTGGV